MYRVPFLSAIALVLLLIGSADATTYQIKPDGTGDFPTIQAALDVLSDGDVISLADGTFRGDGNRDVDFLGKAITVRSTSGDPDSCVIDCESDYPDWHRAFVFMSGEPPEAHLEAIQITNGGYHDEWLRSDIRGGAIHCEDSSPTFLNLILRYNDARLGGAIYCLGGSPTIRDSQLRSNNAFEGGGIYFDGSTGSVSGCLLQSNYGYYAGGGIDAANSVLELTDCDFLSNTAGTGVGGGLQVLTGSAELTRCSFTGNSADWSGGAFYGSSSRFVKCTFSNNETHFGGAVYSEGDLTLEACTFIDNEAYFEGGGAYLVEGDSTSDCEFRGNLSQWESGGIYCQGCGIIEKCLFVGNLGGLALFDGGPLRNCTVVRNYSGVAADATTIDRCIIAFNDPRAGVVCDLNDPVSVICSVIYGNTGGDWQDCTEGQSDQNGNWHTDPLFCDLEGDDFRVDPTSVCAPGSTPCGLIGALPAGCGVSWVDPRQIIARVDTSLQVLPNPTRGSCVVNFAGIAGERYQLKVVDPSGRVVRHVPIETIPGRDAGQITVIWDGRDDDGRPAPSGLYLMRIESRSGARVGRVALLR